MLGHCTLPWYCAQVELLGTPQPLGYTSELLRYAKLMATPDDPTPAFLLAPCLVVLFNVAFSTGQVPQS